jgi:DNA-binding transcriptional ArsR family regulator
VIEEISAHSQFEARDGTEVRGHAMTTEEIFRVDSCKLLDFARIFQALAHPIRLRMLNLMFYDAFCSEQSVQIFGIDVKIVRRHLSYFEDSKLVIVRCKKRTKYYEIRKEVDPERVPLVRLVIELLEHNSTIRADSIIMPSLSQEYPNTTVRDESTAPHHFEVLHPRPPG